MQIFKNPSVSAPFETALILGNFDGFHRAHQALAESAVTYAREHGLTPAAFTFLGAPSKGKTLSSDEEKARFLKDAGIEVLFTFDFDRLKDMEAADFTQKILFETLRAKALFCGFNYRFARGASAGAEDLLRLANGHAVVTVLPPLCDEDGEIISSSKIRTLLAQGNTQKAEKLLGHTL